MNRVDVLATAIGKTGIGSAQAMAVDLLKELGAVGLALVPASYVWSGITVDDAPEEHYRLVARRKEIADRFNDVQDAYVDDEHAAVSAVGDLLALWDRLQMSTSCIYCGHVTTAKTREPEDWQAAQDQMRDHIVGCDQRPEATMLTSMLALSLALDVVERHPNAQFNVARIADGDPEAPTLADLARASSSLCLAPRDEARQIELTALLMRMGEPTVLASPDSSAKD